MASSHKKVVFVLLLLTASSSMLQARMAPSDQQHARADQAYVVKESLPSASQELTRDMAPPMPPAPPASASKTEIAVDKALGDDASRLVGAEPRRRPSAIVTIICASKCLDIHILYR